MPKRTTTVPTPLRTESRICFSVAWFGSPEDALAFAADVEARGYTYNGGFYDGVSCGRETRFDYTDRELGPLYAVTTR